MKLLLDNDRFTITTVIKVLADLNYQKLQAILDIVCMIKEDDKLKNISDDTIYSFYQAVLENQTEDSNYAE